MEQNEEVTGLKLVRKRKLKKTNESNNNDEEPVIEPKKFKLFKTPKQAVYSSVNYCSEDEDESEKRLKEYRENCVTYAAGSLCKKIATRIKCSCITCCNSLTDSVEDPLPEKLGLLIRRKSHEVNLVKPSNSVAKIAIRSEASFLKLVKARKYWFDPTSEQMKLPSKKEMEDLSKELRISFDRDPSLFPRVRQCKSHQQAKDVEEKVADLVHHSIEDYLKMRKYDYGKEYKRNVILKGKPSKRKKLHKIIHFEHQ